MNSTKQKFHAIYFRRFWDRINKSQKIKVWFLIFSIYRVGLPPDNQQVQNSKIADFLIEMANDAKTMKHQCNFQWNDEQGLQQDIFKRSQVGTPNNSCKSSSGNRNNWAHSNSWLLSTNPILPSLYNFNPHWKLLIFIFNGRSKTRSSLWLQDRKYPSLAVKKWMLHPRDNK